MSRKALLAALIAPLLVIVLGIVKAEWHLAHARTWVFAITGYDPRDILRGHYLQYRLVLNESEPLGPCLEEAGQECCLCLTETSPDLPPKVQRATCELARQRCDGILQTRALKGLERYYIPEEGALELERQLQQAALRGEARLVVAIDAAGNPQVQTLRLGEQR